jgi:hypothetical protein
MKKIQIIFNSDVEFVSVLSNVDHKYYHKQGAVPLSKRKCTRVKSQALGSYKREEA